jgi:DNA-binding transcriptional LysR family regulator
MGMMVDIRQMRYFVALAENLHFGRAAKLLNMSQPPLTRQIADLERVLGVHLLERTTRRPVLTLAGRQFLADSRDVIKRFDDACRNAQLVEIGQKGTLKFGFIPHSAVALMPPIVERFTKQFPSVNIQLQERVQQALFESLMDGHLDTAVLIAPDQQPELEMRIIGSERLCLAIYPDHALAAANKIDAKMLNQEPLIAVPPDVGGPLSEACEAYFRDGASIMNVVLETNAQHTILSLVRQRLGVALVLSSTKTVGLSSVIFKELVNAPQLNYVLAWRRGNRNPAIQSLISVLQPSFI